MQIILKSFDSFNSSNTFNSSNSFIAFDRKFPIFIARDQNRNKTGMQMTELKLLSEEERALARESGRRLAQLKNEDRPLRMKLADGEQELEIEVPALAKRTLIDALTALGDGKFVTIVPQNSELTTVQAASYLNVSRPYLIGLLDKGEIEYRKVGTHRRIKYTSLKKYKEEDLSRRKSVLDELASEAQELNLE